MGTTQVTKHIPGYNGFIPKTDLNPDAIKHGVGEKERQTFIKNNIGENFHVKIPGYSGYKPMSVLNERGTIRPHCLSTAGESFK